VNSQANQANKAFIGTFTGKKFFLLKPRLIDIDIRDIAHSLAFQCRWTGQCKYHYSVAQHSYYCSFLGPDNEAFDRLMHDASEAYMGDMNRPLKHFTAAGSPYRQQEAVIQHLIRRKFGLSLVEPPSVHVADQQMLSTERYQLMRFNFKMADVWETLAPVSIKICRWSPEEAEKMFLKRFKQLHKGKA
jgi:5'-deoxynucleotidase YfbR-like HD superfamily hydrolase